MNVFLDPNVGRSRSRAKATLITVAIASLLVVMFARNAWESYKYPVDLKELRRLKVGASETEALRRFGVPQQMESLYGDWRWCYYRSNRPGMICLIFDANKRYKGYKCDDSNTAGNWQPAVGTHSPIK